MLEIKILFTGGTIGSSENDGFICADSDKKFTLIEKAKKKLGTKVGFSSYEVCSVLSENITAQNLYEIAVAIKESIKDSPDGIVLTHGTDTLAYSAAFLSYIFSDCNIPIVLVSSNYILSDSRANGVDNLVGAVEFIRAKKGTGVFVAYKNTGDSLRIHRGTRIVPQLPCSDDIFSIKGSYYAEVLTSGVILNENYSEKKDELTPISPLALTKGAKVLFLEAQPLMALPSLDSRFGAVLIKSFHSGTLPTENEAFIKFTEEARAFSIPIFLVGAEERTQYASTKAFSALGIEALPTMSPSAAYAKLRLLLGKGDGLFSMTQSLSGDIL